MTRSFASTRREVHIRVSVVFGLLLTAGATAFSAECSQVTPETLRAVSKYLQAKVNLPQGVELAVTDRGLFRGTCVHKLRIVSQSRSYAFNQTLFLSPDQSFLTSDVLNINADPRQEEREIREITSTQLALGDRPYLGGADTGKIIVVFSDFQCPYCKQVAPILKNLVSQRSDSKLIFRYFPLSGHDWARPAAEAAACAHKQGNASFWEFHDQLFSEQDQITPDIAVLRFLKLAKSIPSIDFASFQKCIDNRESGLEIDNDIQLGVENGVGATPTIFINGYMLPGVRALEEFESVLDEP